MFDWRPLEKSELLSKDEEDSRLKFMILDPRLCFWIHVFCLCRNLTLWFFLLAGRGHIVGAGFSVLVASIEVDMK